MSGASDKHNRIAGNIFSKIDNHLGNSKCETFIESLKLKADEQNFYYPDVMVGCDKSPKSAYYREEPILLVENSLAFDREHGSPRKARGL